MTENNNFNQEPINNDKLEQRTPQVEPTSKVKSGLVKTAVVAAIAGMLGGGATYGIVSAINPSSNASLSTNGTAKGSTKLANVSVSTNSDVTKAFNKVEKAVVSVVNMQSTQTNSLFGNDNSAQGNSDSSKDSGSLAESSEGSGVIYKKDNGKAYIVTNNHVVAGSSKLEVILSDGTKLTAKLIGTDEISDLAVLSIDSKKVSQVVSFGNSDSIKVGEPAIAIGSPLGSEYATSVTQGIVSAKNRSVDVQTDNFGTVNSTVIQTDAAINPGNSGGPLINSEGQVIGINSMKLASTEVEGMGFAIPSNEVVNIINQLVDKGEVARPALGASIMDLSNVSTQQQSAILKLPENTTTGVVLATVNNNSAASKAGLKKYDVIVAIDGKDIQGSTDLRKILYSHSIGDKVPVTYYRDGKKATTTLKLSQTLNESQKSTSN